MRLVPLHTAHPLYAEAEELMLSAFPPEERRPTAQQREMTDRNAAFHPYAVTLFGKFAGLLTVWHLEGFRYVEHLATSPELRGQGLGALILRKLTETGNSPVVLEVELPENEFSIRRIGFYRRNGFVTWDNQRYIQPPYSTELPPVPLVLMVHGALDEEKDFCHVRREIHCKVYGYSDVFM